EHRHRPEGSVSEAAAALPEMGVQGRGRMGRAEVGAMKKKSVLLLLACAVLGVLLCFLQSTSAAPLLENEEGFQKLGAPKPGEWRDRFKEPAQSYEKYVAAGVNRKSAERTTFYLQ